MAHERLIGGRYRIVRKIAEGGMGEVYEAQHNLSKKSVALKILFPHIGKDEAARQRFLREVSAPAQIGHDAIVEVYDAGFDTQDGGLFVAMELLQGEPLRDRLARGGVPLETLLDWFEEMLEPLAAAHDKGIVHRDLKPENVFMAKRRDGSEHLKILDFGIARDLDGTSSNVTHTGIAMGTPHYMAPEQAMSAKGVSAAADVWALGAMLYEALGGKPPFDGETASAIVVNACTRQHAPLSQVVHHVPPALSAFVDRCLSKEPQGRPADAGRMLEELRQVRRQQGSVPSTAAGLAATAAPGAPGTGPLGVGVIGYTPKGTAMLPQQTPYPGGSHPGGYATPPPSQGGWATPPPGASPAPGHGSGPVGFGTPPPSGGFGTPPSGGFGPGPGTYGSQPGFGAPPSGGYGTSAPAYAQPKRSGGGLALGVIAVVLVGGLVLVGGGIVAALYLLGDADDASASNTSTNIGTVRIQTDVAAGELFVDGTSRGPIVPGQQFRLSSGNRQLEIRERGVAVATASVAIRPGQDQAITMNRSVQAPPPPPPSTNDPAMIPGNVQTFTGSLRNGDETLTSGEYADGYYFDWTAGSRVRIELDSADFDTYLILKAPSGAQQDNDDRGGGNLNAAIDTTLNETGRWQVLATSFSSNVTGDYTLTVRGP